MVTKQQALDAFINERVMGDALFAIGPGTGRCSYSKQVNGGCAIGKFIPDELYDPSLEGQGVLTLFLTQPEIADQFEDSESAFWPNLQASHDHLAVYYTKPDPSIWANFVATLEAAVYA